jgi:hypothetical protein
MQVNNEDQVAQGEEDDLKQQQDQYTATLPCVDPGGSGQITVILPDGQKPSDGQGWKASGQPCASDPDGHGLEPVGIADQGAATGWIATEFGWVPCRRSAPSYWGYYDGIYSGGYDGYYTYQGYHPHYGS